MKLIDNKEGCQASRCRQPPTHEAHGYRLCWKHAQEFQEETGAEAHSTVEGGLPDEEIAALKKERSELQEALQLIEDFEIASQADYSFADGEMAAAMAQWKVYEEKRTKATTKLERALKEVKGALAEVNSWFQPVQSTLKAIERTWKSKLSAYRLAQIQEQQRLLQEARALEQAEEIREKLVAASEAVPQTVNATYIERWVFAVEKPEKVPREFLCPDTAKIGETVGILKDKTNIPGVRVWNDPIVRGKAAQ